MADLARVITRALELTTRLDQQSALQTFVDSAIEVTSCKFGALAVLDSRGETLQFVFSGIEPWLADKIGTPPKGHGLLGDIPDDRYLIVNDLKGGDYPPNHPHLHNFLGVPIRIQDRVFGRLYLSDKDGGFTDDDGNNMLLLAQAAAIAVENSRLYAESNTRAQWIAASRAITTALLEGTDEEEALQLIAKQMRRVSKADAALIILPSVGDTWACEICDGEYAKNLIGVEFPPAGRAQTVIREGTGLIVDAMTRQKNLLVPEIAHFGAALYAPMMSKGTPEGVIVLLREIGKPEFDLADLSMAENVARQAALALELAGARLTQAKADQLEDRAQISRDLHDFAIQQLFASGMELSAVRNDLADQGVPTSVLDGLDKSINSIDESVHQIRQIIYSLRDPQATIPVVERIHREITNAAGSLGYHPTLTLINLGETITFGLHTEVDDELGSDLADDVVAVIRECLSNVARHAHATAADVDIRIENHRIEIRITDNGQGVKAELSRRSGISNLAARARRHHGTFSIRPNQEGPGTRVEWTATVA